MKHVLFAVLVVFSMSATAGNTIKLCASGDPLKGLNVSKSGTHPNPGGKLCEDDGERHVAPPTVPTADPKIDAKQQQKTEASLGAPDTTSRGIVKSKSNITNNKVISGGKGKMPPYGKTESAAGDTDASPNELTNLKK